MGNTNVQKTLRDKSKLVNYDVAQVEFQRFYRLCALAAWHPASDLCCLIVQVL